MSVLADTLDAVRSLSALLDEETKALAEYQGGDAARTLVSQKASLADRVAELTEAMKRAGRQALAAEAPAMHNALEEALAALQGSLAANARTLERRKSLSEGLIAAVLAEAKRQAGTQLAGYGSTPPRSERAAAIAFNANV